MFTGLIEQVGSLLTVETMNDPHARTLTIAADFSRALALGESVAVNGVCLTVVAFDTRTFQVECTPTTLAITTLGSLVVPCPVNLERSATPDTRLGGHWVQGHIDTQGQVVRIEPEGEARHIYFSYPPGEFHRLVPFGAITVDGVSLTVVSTAPDQFHVTLIPYTQAHTTLGALQPGMPVNLEFDILGKYVQQLLTPYRETHQNTN